MPSHCFRKAQLQEKLTIVAIDDFVLRSTAPDADPTEMLALAIETQGWLAAYRENGQARMEIK